MDGGSCICQLSCNRSVVLNGWATLHLSPKKLLFYFLFCLCRLTVPCSFNNSRFLLSLALFAACICSSDSFASCLNLAFSSLKRLNRSSLSRSSWSPFSWLSMFTSRSELLVVSVPTPCLLMMFPAYILHYGRCLLFCRMLPASVYRLYSQ